MQAMKHVGKIGEKPCVILFREVPGDPNFALVVQTNNLPDNQHDSLMNVLQSAEAQQANQLSDVLDRRQFSDGSNMLQQLHFEKRIEKVAVNLVSLTPTPQDSISLEEVNAEIRKIDNKSNPPSKIQADPATLPGANVPIVEAVESPNPSLMESDPTLAELNADMPAPVTAADEVSIAGNLLEQARMLEEDAGALMRDAVAKKEEAYRLNPELEPRKGPGRPKKVK
jgi:hypothetical protein|tara:strand:+ start:3962 stop:4639 length:678 start_codon:yes stop_codon:yes gene_type:complete